MLDASSPWDCGLAADVFDELNPCVLPLARCGRVGVLRLLLSGLVQGGQPEDVADGTAALVFLTSPGLVEVSGVVLRVCGSAFVGG